MQAQTPHRINEILRVYWDGLRESRICPTEAEVNPKAIEGIWNSCFLVEVESPEPEETLYRYAYLGAELIEAFGDDLTGTEISDKLDPNSPRLIQRFQDVVAQTAPVSDEAEFTNRKGMLIKYRSCMLPLTGAENKVAYILGGMKWKAY